jgi:hypothetical protein
VLADSVTSRTGTAVSRNERSNRVANRKAGNKNQDHPPTNRDCEIIHWTDPLRFSAGRIAATNRVRQVCLISIAWPLEKYNPSHIKLVEVASRIFSLEVGALTHTWSWMYQRSQPVLRTAFLDACGS